MNGYDERTQIFENHAFTGQTLCKSLEHFVFRRLSGESPFLGENEADTVRRITEGRWEFCDVFDYVSKAAKDFIMRLLMKEPR